MSSDILRFWLRTKAALWLFDGLSDGLDIQVDHRFTSSSLKSLMVSSARWGELDSLLCVQSTEVGQKAVLAPGLESGSYLAPSS